MTEIFRGERDLVCRYRDGIIKASRDAFAGPPYFESQEEIARFSGRLTVHAGRPGFRISAALDPGQTRVLGFVYGYAVTPDS